MEREKTVMKVVVQCLSKPNWNGTILIDSWQGIYDLLVELDIFETYDKSLNYHYTEFETLIRKIAYNDLNSQKHDNVIIIKYLDMTITIKNPFVWNMWQVDEQKQWNEKLKNA